MSQTSGTTDTYDVTGIREDLEDVIHNLYPGDTYLYNNLESVTAKQTYHEWQNDSLAAAAANAQIEGDDPSFATVTATTRMGNYTQIVRKAFRISDTIEATTMAGRKSEIARQAMKKMREWKRDVELALVGNTASSAGGSAAGTQTARAMGGMETWIASTDHSGNGVRATTSAACSTVGFSSGVTAAPTDGTTLGALTQTKFAEALGLAWAQGGDASVVLAGQTQKAAIDAFAGIAQQTNELNAKAATIVNTVDLFKSDYGTHKIVLHRYIRASVVLCIDPDYWAVAWLRRPKMVELAKTGDAEARMLIGEMTLVARNPLSSAKVAGCS